MVFCGFVMLVLIAEFSTGQSLDITANETVGSIDLLLEIGKKTNNQALGIVGKYILALAEKMASRNKDLEEMVMKKVEQELKDQVRENIQSKLDSLNESQSTLLAAICDLYTCNEWSTWTSCSKLENKWVEETGLGGVKSRTRQCGKMATSCKSKSEETEVQTQLCTPCPDDYEMTSNGFCFKLYQNYRREWQDANKKCKVDGGQLVHVNSELKSKDIATYLYQKTWSRVWIDGFRQDSSSQWQFQSASQKPGFSNWNYGQPYHGYHQSYPDCIYLLDQSDRKWANNVCTSQNDFLCEIRM